MTLRKPLWFVALALLGAAAIVYLAYPASYAEQLVRVQSRQAFARVDPRILAEPLDIQAMLLDYSNAGDRVLALKAWIALLKYPKATRELLPLYGSAPEFQQVLLAHGEAVIPVIKYFREHDVWSVSARDAAARMGNRMKDWIGTLTNPLPSQAPAQAEAPAAPPPAAFSDPDQRGWYAINFIHQEGHDLLAQFDVTADGEAKWNQTDRVTKAVTSFLTSGVRTLETRHDLGAPITTGDVFWAGLDVALISVPFKLLRAGGALARSGEELSVVSRTRLLAPRLLARGQRFQSLGKYGALAATVYIVATHPSLLNSLFAEAAALLGLVPWLLQFVGWTLLILVLLYPFSWLLKLFARATLRVLAWLEYRHHRSHRHAAGQAISRRQPATD